MFLIWFPYIQYVSLVASNKPNTFGFTDDKLTTNKSSCYFVEYQKWVHLTSTLHNCKKCMDPYIGIIHLFFSFFLGHIMFPIAILKCQLTVYGSGLLIIVAVDHTASKMPDPIWTPQQSDARPGQYWAGGLPGNSKELTAYFPYCIIFPIAICSDDWWPCIFCRGYNVPDSKLKLGYIETSKWASADRKAKLTLMLTAPWCVLIVF